VITFRVLNGGILYDLPDGATGRLGFAYSEISASTLKYPTSGINADQLVEDAILIAYQSGVEMINGRWWLQGSEGNATPIAGYKTISGPNLFDIFRRTRVVTTNVKKSLPVTYSSKNPGYILNDLFTAAQARGAMTGVTWDFTASVDSGGVAWPSVINIDYKAGDEYLAIIQSMVSQGLIALCFEGTVIHGYRGTVGFGVDHSTTPPIVEFVSGRDYSETPYKRTTEDRAKYALVLGDDETFAEYTNIAAPTGPFGREEVSISEGGSNQSGYLAFVGSTTIDPLATPQEEFTRKLELAASPYQPHTDFRIGDLVRERVGTTSDERRIVSMVLDHEGGKITGANIVLGTRLLPAAVKARLLLKRVVTRGRGTTVVTPAPDTTTPNPITSLILAKATYLITNGITRAVIFLDWTAPTLNTDATPLTDLAGYGVEWKYTSNTRWNVMTTTQTSAEIADLDVNRSVDYRVRAYDSGNPRHYSTYVSATTTTNVDATPPPVPSTPVLTVKRGTVTIYWDGLNNAAGSMGSDFHHVEVHRSIVSGFTPSGATLYDRMYGRGILVAEDQAYGTPWYYKYTSVDDSGNVSAGSTQAVVTSSQLVGGDLANLSIAAGHIQANAVETDKLDVGAVTAEKIRLGTFSTNMIADPSFEEDYTIAAFSADENHHWSIKQQYVSAGDVANIYRITNPGPRSGQGALGTALTGSNTAGGEGVQLYSNVIPVVAGEQWTMRAYYARYESTGDADIYIRLAGGSTAALTEYPATSAGNRIAWTDDDPNLGEDMTLMGTGARPLSGEYQEFRADITIPAGVAFVAVSLHSVRAAAEVHNITVYFDDISFTKVGQGALEVTSAGVRLFDEDGSEMAAMVSNRPNVFSVMRDGATLASMSDQGQVSGRTMSVEGVDTDSDGLEDSGFEVYGTEFLEWLDQFPRGIVAWENFADDRASVAGAETGYGEIGFLAKPGRLYRVQYRCMIENDAAGPLVLRLRMTYADDPTAAADPKVTSPLLLTTNLHPSSSDTVANADYYFNDFTMLYNETTTPRNVRILATMAGGSTVANMRAPGGGASTFASPEGGLILSAEDVGPYRAQGGGYNEGGVSAPPAPTVTTYVKTWTSTSAKSYMGSGAQDSSQGPSDMKQGYSSYDGNSKSLWIFPSLTSTLSGATITKIRAYLYANHWYYNSGGTALVKVHGYTSAPGSSPSMTTALTSSGWPKPGGRWVTLPSSLYAGFVSGTYRGIGVGPGASSSQTYYGRFNRDGAKLEITYKK